MIPCLSCGQYLLRCGPLQLKQLILVLGTPRLPICCPPGDADLDLDLEFDCDLDLSVVLNVKLTISM